MIVKEFFFDPFNATLWRYVMEGVFGYDWLQYLGLLLPILFGLAIICLIDRGVSLKEKVFLSFPVGMAMISFLMFFMLLLNIQLSATSLTVTTSIFSLAAATPMLLRPERLRIRGLKDRWRRFIDVRNFDLIWTISWLLTLYILFSISLKTVFWPTFDSDAINSFELFAKAISAENSFVNSVVIDKSTGRGIPYPPFVPLAITYFFKFGFVKSKLLFASLLASFVFAFYAVVRHYFDRTAAAVWTLFMVMTPEMMAFAALTKTNVVQMIYASSGFIYLFLFLRRERIGFLYLGALLLALNAWTRSEGIEFLFIGGVALVYYAWRKGLPWRRVFEYSAICVTPFLCWQLFLQVNHEHFDHVIQVSLIKYPFWDGDKFYKIWAYFKGHMQNTQYYGIVFYVFLTAVALNLLFYFRKREHLMLLMITGVLVSHFILLYQFDYLGNNMVHLLKHSLKRYYFNFIPLIVFYIGATPFIQQFFQYYRKFIRS